MADIGALVVVARILRPSNRALILIALAPASIMISGFHGNSDPVMIFFALLAIYFLEVRQAAGLSAICLGVACCIKVVPVILLPSIMSYMEGNLRRFQYCLVSGATFLVLSLPYIAQDPSVIVRNVFGYRSLPGIWGFPRLGAILEVTSGRFGFVAMATRLGSILVVVSLAGLAFWFRRRGTPLFTRCAVSMFTFLWLSPGFGVQYLAWIVPFAIIFGKRAALAVYLSSGLFLALVYTYWCQGFPWYYANSNKVGPWTWRYVPFELAAWAVIGFLVLTHLRTDPKRLSSGLPQGPAGQKDRLPLAAQNLF
jgi:hypothetical protein